MTDCAGCNAIETTPKTLLDGRVVCGSCEEWRHECEARFIAKMPTRVERQAYLAGIRAKRGRAAVDRLQDTLRDHWKALRA